jgi:hypothetical protein
MRVAPIRRRAIRTSFHSENIHIASKAVIRLAIAVKGPIIEIGVSNLTIAIDIRAVALAHDNPTQNAIVADPALIDFSLIRTNNRNARKIAPAPANKIK